MTAAYIHIGDYKCGSTSIQTSFFSSNELLHKSSYHYSISAGVDNHFWAAYWDDGSRYARECGLPKEQAKNLVDKGKENFAREVNAHRDKNFIISSEFISSMPISEHSEFHDFFSKLFSKVYIIAYMRHPTERYKSHIVERVKTGQCSLKQALTEKSHNITIRKLDSLANTFGKDKLRIRKFGRAFFKNNSLLEDFCFAINLNCTEYPKENRKNESISTQALLVADKLFEIAPRHSKHRANASYLYSIAGDTYHPPKEEVDDLLRKSQEYLTLLRDNYQVDFLSDEITTNEEVDNYKFPEQSIYDIAHLLNSRHLLESEIDSIRDASLSIAMLNPKIALDLMKIAEKLRPEGQFIKNKIKELEKLAKQGNES
ncbi:hypothetical protein BTJ40_14125 [Microbulbifer sp. A4B17]|uniref:hypothetical protein n=1 Tax=Microbulbifer sp. A4B17 TaxID=359370 RepID=UPI000D52ACB9|nr:hypothetical protein [Microbulbifer sp. A4B17]AWF81871.1 hypothetical protein BTJ40_14125 [Microbulbifer sp. A4B17]